MSAQVQTGSITGVVLDQERLPLPGAVVLLSGDLLPDAREFVTDASGQFLFPRLVPGTYHVTAAIPGMMDVGVAVTVAVARDTQVELVLAPAVTETIEVRASVPVIDVRSAEVATNFTRAQFENLPLARSYAGLFELAPGIAQNNAFAGAPGGVSFGLNAGGSRQENTYLIDGINITNPAFGHLQQDVNELDIQEVNIKRGGITAEFGRTGGFVSNAVTRSGGNRVSAQGRLELLPDSFSAGSRDPNLASSFDRYGPALALGGPIVRDRAWFYGSGQWIRRWERNRVNRLGALPDEAHGLDEYFGKGTASPNVRHVTMLSFRFRGLETRNAGMTSTAHRSTGRDETAQDRLLVGSWTWFPRPALNLDVRYTSNTSLNAQTPIRPIQFRQMPFDIADPSRMGWFLTTAGFIVGGAAEAGQRVGGGELAVNDQDYFRHELKATFSWFRSAGRYTHDLRVGAGFDRGSEELARVSNGWGNITVASAALRNANCGGRACYRAAYVLPQEQISIGRTYSLFAQDRMSMGQRTTIVAGLLLTRDEYVGNGDIPLLTFNFLDEVQPRLGISYVPALAVGDKVYASYGRYYNLDNRSFSRAAAPRRIFTSDAWIDLETGEILNDAPRSAETGKIILRGVEPTYTDELLVGYSRPLWGGWFADVWGMLRRTTNFIEDFPDPDSPLGPRNPTSPYVIGNLNGGAHDPAEAYRRYSTVVIELNRPMRDGWSISSSYGWSRLRGNWDIDYSPTAQVFFASSILHDGPGLFIDDPLREGLLLGDRTHVVKVFGNRQISRALVAGAYLRAQSGAAWQGNTQDIFSGFRQYAEQAGSRRMEAWTNLDVLASYSIWFGTSRAVLEGRVLNLLNQQAALTMDQRVDFASFGLPTSFAPPRRFLATARVDF